MHVTDGSFKGVTGRVARYQGQQRVAVTVSDFVTACTTYVPSAFLREKNVISTKNQQTDKKKERTR